MVTAGVSRVPGLQAPAGLRRDVRMNYTQLLQLAISGSMELAWQTHRESDHEQNAIAETRVHRKTVTRCELMRKVFHMQSFVRLRSRSHLLRRPPPRLRPQIHSLLCEQTPIEVCATG